MPAALLCACMSVSVFLYALFRRSCHGLHRPLSIAVTTCRSGCICMLTVSLYVLPREHYYKW